MRKKIILGTFIAVFLLLMIPNINAVEYNQVENSTEEKINILAERIIQQLERADEKQLNVLNKFMDVDGFKQYLGKIINGDICLSCKISEDYNFTKCMENLVGFLGVMFVALITMIFFVGIIILFNALEQVMEIAERDHCLWAIPLAAILNLIGFDSPWWPWPPSPPNL